MAGPEFLSNQPQIDISMGQAVFIDALLASVNLPAPSKIKQWFPSLREDMQGAHDVPVGGQDVQIVQDVLNLIPGPGGVVANGEAANVQLLQDEQLDVEETNDPNWITENTGKLLLQYQSFGQSIKQIRTVCAAVRTILDLEILDNAITVQHYRWIVKRLRDHLRQAAPDKIPHGEAYARILKRLAQRLMTLTNQQDSESALYLRPIGYVEFLDKLLNDMEKGFVVMKLSGIEDDVYIIKDMELLGYSELLCSLASRLIGLQKYTVIVTLYQHPSCVRGVLCSITSSLTGPPIIMYNVELLEAVGEKKVCFTETPLPVPSITGCLPITLLSGGLFAQWPNVHISRCGRNIYSICCGSFLVHSSVTFL